MKRRALEHWPGGDLVEMTTYRPADKYPKAVLRTTVLGVSQGYLV